MGSVAVEQVDFGVFSSVFPGRHHYAYFLNKTNDNLKSV